MCVCSVPVLILFNFLLCPFLFHVQFSFSILLISTAVLLFFISYLFYLQSFLIHRWKYELLISPFLCIFLFTTTCLCSCFHLAAFCSGLLYDLLSLVNGYIKKNNLVFSTLGFDYFFLHSPISCLTFSLSWHHWWGVCWVFVLREWSSGRVSKWVSDNGENKWK